MLRYKDLDKHQLQLKDDEERASGFTSANAQAEASAFPADIEGRARNTFSVTAGAYER